MSIDLTYQLMEQMIGSLFRCQKYWRVWLPVSQENHELTGNHYRLIGYSNSECRFCPPGTGRERDAFTIPIDRARKLFLDIDEVLKDAENLRDAEQARIRYEVEASHSLLGQYDGAGDY